MVAKSHLTKIHPLTIIIDGREMSKKRGLGHFLRELLYNIDQGIKAGSDNSNFVCLIPANAESDLSELRCINFVRLPFPGAIIWEQIVLPFVSIVIGATHILSPYNTYPLIRPPHVKLIVVCHDLIFLHGKRVRSSLRLRLGNAYRAALFNVLPKSSSVLTVSNYTKELLFRFRKIDSVVIGNNVNHLEKYLARRSENSEKESYFLHVGGDASTKNTKLVIEAYLTARVKFGSGFPRLVIIGTSYIFAKRFSEGCQRDGIDFRVGVSDQEKCDLFKFCKAVVFPSLQEGFGLPIIEGHAAGVTVITSRKRPLSDLANYSDILVDPHSLAEIAQALIEAASRSKMPSHVTEKWCPVDQYKTIREIFDEV